MKQGIPNQNLRASDPRAIKIVHNHDLTLVMDASAVGTVYSTGRAAHVTIGSLSSINMPPSYVSMSPTPSSACMLVYVTFVGSIGVSSGAQGGASWHAVMQDVPWWM